MSSSTAIPNVSKTARAAAGEGISLDCWCGGGPWRQQFRARKFGLLRCESCGCSRIDPPPLQLAAESAAFYDAYYRNVGKKVVRLEDPFSSIGGDLGEIAVRMPRLARVGKRALDFGCGDGHRCAQLKAAGWEEVIGYDISESRLALAREAYPDLRLESRSPLEMGLEPASIDLLVMEHIIEHFPDPLGELQALRRLMAPDSTVMLSTPNIASGHFKVLGRRWTGMLAPHAHIFLFDPATLGLLLEKAGFETLAKGSLQKPFYTLGSLFQRLGSGDLRGAAWRINQELGAAFGRLIGAGPIAYAVARPKH